VEPVFHPGRHGDRPDLHQRGADRILSGGQRSAPARVHPDARIGHTDAGNLYFLQTDRWYLERRIYIVVGVNISLASILVLAWTPWWMLFTFFVGGAMVWLVLTGYCIVANALYWLGAEPRLNPEHMPSARCDDCAVSAVCVSNPRATPA
jgi:hypothetical protein